MWISFNNYNTLLINIYIPHLHAVNNQDLISTYITNSTDWFVNSHVNYSLSISGKVNRFNLKIMCLHLHILNLVTVPTHGAAIFVFFISTDAHKLYYVNVWVPTGR